MPETQTGGYWLPRAFAEELAELADMPIPSFPTVFADYVSVPVEFITAVNRRLEAGTAIKE